MADAPAAKAAAARCHVCAQPAEKLKCVKCKTPYCSVACQTVDWKEMRAATRYGHDDLGLLRRSKSGEWFWQTVEDMTQPEVSSSHTLCLVTS